MTEKEFSRWVISTLNPYFIGTPEQYSKCGSRRLDFIIQDKNNTDIAFGIEFKKSDHKKGENLGNHILQSMRYSLLDFPVNNIFRRIPILLCPPISYNYLMCPVYESKIELKSSYHSLMAEYYHDRHEKNHRHHTVNGMIGAMNIGEIRTIVYRGKQHIYFSFSNKVIWTSETEWDTGNTKGLHEKNYTLLINKINKFEI